MNTRDAAVAGQRRTRITTAGQLLGQLRQARGQVADLAADLAGALAERDRLRLLVVDMVGSESHHWCRAHLGRAVAAAETGGVERGRQMEAAERDRLWDEQARPIAYGGPSHADLEVLRWGPGGRSSFAAPRPGDYTGGPVDWPEPGEAARQ